MEKRKIQNSLGMFDFLKGLSMILVIFHHSLSIFDLWAHPVFTKYYYRCDSLIGEGIFYALFLVGGYNFGKRSVKKHFTLQCRTMLLPFFYTAVFSVGCHCVLHFFFFHSVKAAVIESLRLALSIFLGVPTAEPAPVFGFSLFFAGPLWYILASFWAVVLLNIILNHVKETYVPFVLLAVFLVGCAIGDSPRDYFSLGRGLVVCPLTYIGYRFKKDRLLTSDKGRRITLLLSGLLSLGLALYLIPRAGNHMIDLSWMGLVIAVQIFSSAIFAFFLFTIIGTATGKLADAVCVIGRYSLHVYLVHSVEYFFPWYLLADLFTARPLLGALIVTLCRSVIIVVGCALIPRLENMKNRLLSRASEAKK